MEQKSKKNHFIIEKPCTTDSMDKHLRINKTIFPEDIHRSRRSQCPICKDREKGLAIDELSVNWGLSFEAMTSLNVRVRILSNEYCQH